MVSFDQLSLGEGYHGLSYSLPIQGTTVTFLTKDKTGPVSSKWIRHVADVYGDPKQLQLGGTGTLPRPYITFSKTSRR